ncbi:MAG: DUF5333 family protein [Pseudomonadota bacterium]
MIARWFTAATIIGALAGCQTTTNGVQPAAAPIVNELPQTSNDATRVTRAERESGQIPDEMYDVLIASAFARQIAQRCSDLRYNRGTEKLAYEELERSLVRQGYTAANVRNIARNLPTAQIQGDFIDYIEANDIVIAERDSTCAAGKREVSNRSEIGRYLLVRG